MKVTNTQSGPRGLNTEDGPVLVEPGATVNVKLSAAERKVSEATGWFTFGKPSPDDMDEEALRARLSEVGVEPDGRWGKAKLIEEIRKAEAKS